MTEQATSTASALVQTLSARFKEPAWLKAERERAYQVFESTPSPRLEKTDLTKRSWNVGPFPTTASAVQSPDLDTLIAKFGDTAFAQVIDGVSVNVQLPDEIKQTGVVFTDLHTAISTHEDLVRQYLGTVVPADENKWTALNAALWHGGVFLYVPKNVIIDEPFQFVYVETAAGNGAVPRVLIIGEEGSQFSFSEVYVVAGDRTTGTVHSSVTEVVAKPHAQITVTGFNQLPKGPTNFITRRAVVEKDANVDWVFGDVGDGFTVALVESHLKGTGSRSTSKGVGLGFGRAHMELTASMIHFGRFSESDTNVHAVVRGRANTTYRTKTHIVRGAAAAGSEQSDRMLVLDGTARADAIPMLLIDENEVKRCGHAASVGKIDAEQIYYLMSRGIPKSVATKMIIWGFLGPTLDAMPSEAIRDFASTCFDRELVE